ncbi:ATP phosphoribosyltransferase (ATP-PRTase) (ATP-PRT) [Pleurotus pulmonarius]|nr:ATP phosphoribosyltransferase (ATP-PRTase) (ATP-PRT) [Pleurotus pulmonarius]
MDILPTPEPELESVYPSRYNPRYENSSSLTVLDPAALDGRLLFAIPKKGRLHEKCLSLLAGADIQFRRHDRLDVCLVKNHPIALVFLPASDIPSFVGKGNVDLGITGHDVILEAQMEQHVTEALRLGFGKCALQVQAPEAAVGVRSVEDLAGKRIVTSFEWVAGKYFRELDERLGLRGEEATKIEYVGGSVEAACSLGLADGIVDLVESGDTMRAAGLHAIATVLETEAVLIKSSTPKHPHFVPLIEVITSRVQGVIAAGKYVVCEYNIHRAKLPEATALTPGRRAPTISPLEEEGWVAVSAMVEKFKVADIMDGLRKIGAEDILIFKIDNYSSLAVELPPQNFKGTSAVKRSPQPPRMISLPPEIWIRVLTFLPDPEVVRLYGVDLLFYDVAMARRYGHLSLADYAAFERTKACVSTARLQKHVKAACIFNIFSNPETMSPVVRSPSATRGSRLKRLVLRATKALRRSKNRASASLDVPTLVHDCILSVLGGAENIQELSVWGPWSASFEQSILQPLHSALSTRPIRKLHVESDNLCDLLPFTEFLGLEEVSIEIMQPKAELSQAPQAFSRFIKHIAPSIRILSVASWEAHSVLRSIAGVLLDGVDMPNLRELSIPFMPTATATDTINSKFSLLTKLDLEFLAPTASLALQSLRLPHLRTLSLTFRRKEHTTGFWAGSASELPQLEELRVCGRHLPPGEVAQCARFFSESQITRLILRVGVLDGPLVDLIAASFPVLGDLHLQAQSLASSGTMLATHMDVFWTEMEERRYPQWRLSQLFVSLYLPYYMVIANNGDPAKQVMETLVRAIPSIESTDPPSFRPTYHV